jgi:hypothetical protein
LADKGFYKDWPEDYLQVLFEGRQDPRWLTNMPESI